MHTIPTRTETDSMGPIEVPAGRLWGAQTQRSRKNFRIGGHTFTRPMIRALGLVKLCAARVNRDLGELDMLTEEQNDALIEAAREVVAGDHDDHFPLVVWQTGSGTQSNMNTNEVIANRAIQLLDGELGSKTPIHPNDHCNRAQSSNDTFPTAMHVAAAEELNHTLILLGPRGPSPMRSIGKKAGPWKEHGQDRPHAPAGRHAPDSWARRSRRLGASSCDDAAARSPAPPAARPATSWPWAAPPSGTGLNTHPALRGALVADEDRRRDGPRPSSPPPTSSRRLAAPRRPGLRRTAPCKPARRGPDEDRQRRALARVSGPRCGLGELKPCPANEPGSSIMPGKVNPTQCEALDHGLHPDSSGNDMTVALRRQPRATSSSTSSSR